MIEKLYIQTDIQKNERFIKEAVAASDANTESLGFLPRQVFRDKNAKGSFWVAVDSNNTYLGHLIYGGEYPFLKIVQLYCEPKFRGQGVASNLLNKLISYGNEHQYAAIKAEVAADLKANQFYQKNGFVCFREFIKSKTTERIIKAYQFELDRPDFFKTLESRDQSFTPINQFKLEKYYFDLNALLDISSERRDRGSDVLDAHRNGTIKVNISPEIYKELNRAKFFDTEAKNVADLFHELDLIDSLELNQLVEKIRKLVFPERKRNSKKAEQDNSDLTHLAYAIRNNIPYFVTNESAILKASQKLQAEVGIEVIALSELIHSKNEDFSLEATSLKMMSGAHELEVFSHKKLKNNLKKEKELYGFLDKAIDARGFFENDNFHVMASLNNKDVITPGAPALEAFLKSNTKINPKDACIEYLIDWVLNHPALKEYSQIDFRIPKNDIPCISKLDFFGFFEQSTSTLEGYRSFSKLIMPKFINEFSWPLVTHNLSLSKNIIDEKKPERFDSKTTIRNSRGATYNLSTQELEQYFYPSKIHTSDRDYVIIPIKPEFSNQLVYDSDQPNLFPNTSARFFAKKAYFRSPTHTKLIQKGQIAIFYETSPSQKIVGTAVVDSSEVRTVDEAYNKLSQIGVFDKKEIKSFSNKDGKVHVFTFSAFTKLDAEISCRQIKKVVPKFNPISPFRIKAEQALTLLNDGYICPTNEILISINPKFSRKILNGTKKVEFRKKTLPQPPGTRMWIYSTDPDKGIVGFGFLNKTIPGTPENIWEKYADISGMNKNDFFAYYKGTNIAYAHEIIGVKELRKKITLIEMREANCNFQNPPQSFQTFLKNPSLLGFIKRKYDAYKILEM